MSLPVMGIALFDGVELLDFAGPMEVFAVAAELAGEPPWKVLSVAMESRRVTTAHGLRLTADVDRHGAPELHGLLIPGGNGVRPLMANLDQMSWLAAQGKRVDLLMSVCTGALVLGAAGLLDGRRATTHQQFLDELTLRAPGCQVAAGQRLVADDHVLTSAGVSAGLDLALFVVRQRLGNELAARVSAYVEYPPEGAGIGGYDLAEDPVGCRIDDQADDQVDGQVDGQAAPQQTPGRQ